MRETLYNAQKLDETRVRRAFRWVITFRDFPVGSYQTVDGDSMMSEAITLFTKGRAEFYLDGVRRGDRVPGILSTEHDEVGRGGTFTLKYVEPTTRVCIPAALNGWKLPSVVKHEYKPGEIFEVEPMGQYLVCLGEISLNGKTFTEEKTFVNGYPKSIEIAAPVMLLEFLRVQA